MPVCGYGSRGYAEALLSGAPVKLEQCDGWVIERKLQPGPSDARTQQLDLVGPYPLFACSDWNLLYRDLDEYSGEALSISLVTSPFAEVSTDVLAASFSDVCLPYKQHFIADLEIAGTSHISDGHRRNARKSLRKLRVEHSAAPMQWYSEWISLYDNLIGRHEITGPARFSPASFQKQLQLPGMLASAAIADEQIAGIVLWYLQGDVAYYHLGAYSKTGYDLRASFAIFSEAIHWLPAHARYLALGAGAGINPDASDGLTRFKRGWSTGTKTVYFCGRILNDDAYHARSQALPSPFGPQYFPAYRVDD